MSKDMKLAQTPEKYGSSPSFVGGPASPAGGVKEKALILNRPNASYVGTVYVDDPGTLSNELVAKLKNRAFVLNTRFTYPKLGMLHVARAYGQMGYIRVERLPSSPDSKRSKTQPSGDAPADPVFARYSVDPVTARHNVMNHSVVVGEVKYPLTYKDAVTCSVTSQSDEIAITFPDGGAPPNGSQIKIREGSDDLDQIVWNLVDSTKADRVNQKLHQVTKASYSFAKAENYTAAVGHKIGIVVWRHWEVSKEDAMFTGTDSDWESKRQELFGPRGTPCVYTGEIVRVSSDGQAFEHNINTFKGCSGAIVFLLDQNQPASVLNSQYGAAIGVHVGAAPEHIQGSEVNLAFSLP